MAVTTQTGVPSQIQSGDTTIFQVVNSDYPPDSWSAAFILSRNGTSVSTTAATESGTAYTFTLSAVTTAALAAGTHSYVIRYTETATSQVETGERGQVLVLPNIGANQTASIAQQMLTALEQTILSLSASGNQSVSFNGQSFTKRDMGQLMRMRTELKAEVRREQDAIAAMMGENTGRKYQVRFC